MCVDFQSIQWCNSIVSCVPDQFGYRRLKKLCPNRVFRDSRLRVSDSQNAVLDSQSNNNLEGPTGLSKIEKELNNLIDL